MSEILLTNQLDSKGVLGVMDIIRGERLWIPTLRDYPRHEEWTERTEFDLLNATKNAFLACIDGAPAGAIIYRQGADPSCVDIRNISIVPSARGRLLGSFMLRQVEGEVGSGRKISVDTKISNEGMISFLETSGYSVTRISDLYDDGTGEDVILEKNIA